MLLHYPSLYQFSHCTAINSKATPCPTCPGMTHNSEYMYTTLTCPLAFIPSMPRGHSTLCLPHGHSSSDCFVETHTPCWHSSYDYTTGIHTPTATWAFTLFLPGLHTFLCNLDSLDCETILMSNLQCLPRRAATLHQLTPGCVPGVPTVIPLDT